MKISVIILSIALLTPAFADHGGEHECEDRWEGCYHTVPEIDGATLPKAILLLVSLYLLASASSKRRS
jgi:hypothetical protein